ncbi:unnamed protein product, partial [Callosobruchus maculatus]
MQYSNKVSATLKATLKNYVSTEAEDTGCSREPSTAESINEGHDIVAEDISESDTDDSSSISGSPHEDDFA